MFHAILSAVLLISAAPCFSNNHVRIASQEEFDNLGNTIIRMLSKGELEIRVSLAPGTYFYDDNHIDLSGKKYPNASIKIDGQKATLIAKGKRHAIGAVNDCMPEHGFVTLSGENLELWDDAVEADGLVEVVSESQKLCRLKSKRYGSGSAGDGMYIQLTQWYLSGIYPIVRTNNGYVYFTVSNLKGGYGGGWNINNDYQFGKILPRYRVFGNKVVKEPFYECTATRFLVLGYGTELDNVVVEGLRFCGNARAGEKPVIACLSPRCKVNIKGCEFVGMRSSRVISVGNKNKVTVEKCCFKECYEYGIIASHNASDTRIVDCVFSNMGLGWSNSFCVSCAGVNYYVANNDFQDFGYGAIACGFGYSNDKNNLISGVAEHNTLSFTPTYKTYMMQYGLMDGGAIYLSTQNDHSVIRYNTIDNYSGAYGNHGIFCDDGANGFEIYGNMITHIDNGRCIAARRDASIESEKNPKSKVLKTNVNNVVRDNIMDGSYLFWGNEQAGNGCVKGTNYLISSGDVAPKFEGGNFDRSTDDVFIQADGLEGGKLLVSRATYNRLSQSKEWNMLKKNIKRK